jgi:hypothetical protein
MAKLGHNPQHGGDHQRRWQVPGQAPQESYSPRRRLQRGALRFCFLLQVAFFISDLHRSSRRTTWRATRAIRCLTRNTVRSFPLVAANPSSYLRCRQDCRQHLLWPAPPAQLDHVRHQRCRDCVQPVGHGRRAQRAHVARRGPLCCHCQRLLRCRHQPRWHRGTGFIVTRAL